MKVSKRLQIICDMVDKGSHIVDVGCDHAHVCIKLTIEKDVQAIASDINSNAINIAKENIKKHGLEDRIQTVLTDGTSGIDIKNKTIIICGMGTKTIISIISSMEYKKVNSIVIQSNHNIEGLRKFLFSKNFEVIEEYYLVENKKHYVIFKVIPNSNINYNKKDILYGPILRKNSKNYLEYLIKRENKILINLPKSKYIKRYSQNKKIRRIEKELKNLI